MLPVMVPLPASRSPADRAGVSSVTMARKCASSAATSSAIVCVLYGNDLLVSGNSNGVGLPSASAAGSSVKSRSNTLAIAAGKSQRIHRRGDPARRLLPNMQGGPRWQKSKDGLEALAVSMN